MLVRILTAIPLVSALIYALSFSKDPLVQLLLFTVAIFLAATEFIALRWHAIDADKACPDAQSPQLSKRHFVVGAATAGCLPMQYIGDRLIGETKHGQYIVFMWVAVCLVFLSAFLYRKEDELDVGIQKLLNALSGFAYLAIPGITVVHLSQIHIEGSPQSILTYFGLAAIIMGDTGAYFAGRAFGKRKLLPKVSPKKTVEGAIGGLVASLLTGILVVYLFHIDIPYWQAGMVAAFAGAAGQIGDLVESAIKRSARCKDSGTLLPGHGGVLDRIDAMIFGIPFCYVMFVLLQTA